MSSSEKKKKAPATERIKRVREGLDGLKLEALLVTGLSSIRYLTGFSGSSAFLYITKRGATLFTDSRYKTQAAEEVKGARVKIYKKSWIDDLALVVKKNDIKRLGFESGEVSHALWSRLKSALKGTRLKPTKGVVEGIRRVKDPSEIELLKRAITVAEAGFHEARLGLRQAVTGTYKTTEKELAARVDYAFKKNGADALSFDIIIASGERSALPHGKASSKAIGRRELVIVDMGVMVDGYASDETRTYVTGRPTKEQAMIHRTVKEAHDLAIEKVAPGVKCADIDRAARAHIEEAGFGKYFGHGTGHGVGLDVHEGPNIGPTSEDILTEGMVFTVEPGIYLPGVGGVRLEDMVLVTPGGPELLTSGSKDLDRLDN